MNILGIFGSPRKGGNSDILLQEALDAAEKAGATVSTLRVCDLNIQGCIECGGCDETGVCVVEDDMSLVYPKLLDSEVIILASPIFFYSIPAQAKALIDRCQALYCRRRLQKESGIPGAGDYKGGGYLICVGATKGKNLFDGVQLVARYFYDAVGKAYKGGIQIRSVEGKGEVSQRLEYLQEARELGSRIVRDGP